MAFTRNRNSKTWYAAWDCLRDAASDTPIRKGAKTE
jgi:hypothetical protein